MLSRALSPKASKGKLEENHWADVFNACSSNPHPASQPETSIGGGGEPAPYVERRASAHAPPNKPRMASMQTYLLRGTGWLMAYGLWQ